jgi:hypothetical protein
LCQQLQFYGLDHTAFHTQPSEPGYEAVTETDAIKSKFESTIVTIATNCAILTEFHVATTSGVPTMSSVLTAGRIKHNPAVWAGSAFGGQMLNHKLLNIHHSLLY